MSKLPSQKKARPDQIKRLNYRVEEGDNMSNLHVLMTLSYFIGLFLIFFYYSKTFISLIQLFVQLLFILALTFTVPIHIYRKKLTMSFYEYYIMNFISLTPILYALFLLLNYHISLNSYIEIHQITNRKLEGRNIELALKNNAYSDYEFIRTINSNDRLSSYNFNHLKLHLSDGLFGMKVLKEKEFIEVKRK